MTPLPCDMDKIGFAQLFDALADGACDCPVATELATDVSDCLSWACRVRMAGGIHCHFSATLLDTHKELTAIAVSKCL